MAEQDVGQTKVYALAALVGHHRALPAECGEFVASIVVGLGLDPHHVVVDEAQDLGPRELAFARRLAASGPRALFFVGDAGQRVYRYPFSWTQAGVDVRGRARRLRVNYRTSEQIRHFADQLLPARIAELGDIEEDRTTRSLFTGPLPEVVACQNDAGQAAVLERWLREIFTQGLHGSEIAILARDDATLQAIVQPALGALGRTGAPFADPAPSEQSVYCGMLEAAKGLEFRAAAVVGADESRIPRTQDLDAEETEDGRDLVVARERRLFYVGCTRARETLLVVHGPHRTRFLPDAALGR